MDNAPGAIGRAPTATRRALTAIGWLAAAWIAYEFLFYLQYKLTGQTLIFDRLSEWSGIPEKPIRLGVAAMETVAAVLVLIPRTQVFGALFAMGIMSGAILFHLFTPLGVDPYEDGGNLFKEACFTWAMAAIILVIRREELLALTARFLPSLRPVSRSAPG
jgi:uncharacterized membrane protein YphA (DoxX/SURF4 family)